MLSAIRAESEKAMKIRKCPLCGKEYTGEPAINRAEQRTADREEICPDCGTKQALTQYLILTGGSYQTREINSFGNTGTKARNFLLKSYERHLHFDWGEMDEEDLCTNDIATVSGDRLFSSYNIPDDLQDGITDDKIWIITEADRSVTTILFPSEY